MTTMMTPFLHFMDVSRTFTPKAGFVLKAMVGADVAGTGVKVKTLGGGERGTRWIR